MLVFFFFFLFAEGLSELLIKLILVSWPTLKITLGMNFNKQVVESVVNRGGGGQGERKLTCTEIMQRYKSLKRGSD